MKKENTVCAAIAFGRILFTVYSWPTSDKLHSKKNNASALNLQSRKTFTFEYSSGLGHERLQTYGLITRNH